MSCGGAHAWPCCLPSVARWGVCRCSCYGPAAFPLIGLTGECAGAPQSFNEKSDGELPARRLAPVAAPCVCSHGHRARCGSRDSRGLPCIALTVGVKVCASSPRCVNSTLAAAACLAREEGRRCWVDMREAACMRASRLPPCSWCPLCSRTKARWPRSVLVRRDPVGAVHRAGALAGEDAYAGAAPPCSACGSVACMHPQTMHALHRVWLERWGRGVLSRHWWRAAAACLAISLGAAKL